MILVALAFAHCRIITARPDIRSVRPLAVLGWAVVAVALMSPLCALSVSLFSARVAQHTVLMLLAAPLIAIALPGKGRELPLKTCGLFFMTMLWFWHMPVPYAATFSSTGVYWCMHITLFAAATLLWHALLHHHPGRTITAFVVATFTSMQMGILGALLAFADRPLFSAHILTAPAWGLTPLQDQQLGGLILWVPGMLVFLWISLRSLRQVGGAFKYAQAVR